ncbi:MAG: cysteine synthase B, partial [Dehalococcoidia bacterium]|nr:cysteine synthase B [Dehalococcoidia bacterium]
LADRCGIFAGLSTGAALAGSLRVAERVASDGGEAVIVFLASDAGWKYLSTGIYGEGFRFDQSEIEGKTWW